jgi:hypothetical protein
MPTTRKGEDEMTVAKKVITPPQKATENNYAEDPKEFGRWLNRAIHLKANRVTKKTEVVELVRNLFKELGLGGRKKNLKRHALNCVLANLFLAHWLDVPVMYSRDHHRYSLPKRYRYNFFTRSNIIPIIDALEEADLVEDVGGRFDIGKMGRIWASDELLDRMDMTVEDIERLPLPDPIILRDASKKQMDYKDTEETRMMRGFLHTYNSFLKDTEVEIRIPLETFRRLTRMELVRITIMDRGVTLDPEIKKLLKTLSSGEKSRWMQGVVGLEHQFNPIQYPDPYIPLLGFTNTIRRFRCDHKDLHRVFSRGSFQLGGRFYGCGVHNLSKRSRRHTFINDEPTVEIDYSSMHLRMLYHLRGLEAPDGDLYDFGVSRELNNVVGLIIVNCEPHQDRLKAISHHFKGKKKLREKFGDEIMSHDFIRKLIADFKAAHPKIRDDFFSGCGLKLQYRDSLIMEDLLKHFTRKGVPIIPVHDSLIVPESHTDEAREVMKETYKKHMGFDAVVG